jgi:hypothetical protein
MPLPIIKFLLSSEKQVPEKLHKLPSIYMKQDLPPEIKKLVAPNLGKNLIKFIRFYKVKHIVFGNPIYMKIATSLIYYNSIINNYLIIQFKLMMISIILIC